jgi:hypothetical protein
MTSRAIATRRNDKGFPEPAYLNAPEQRKAVVTMSEWMGRSTSSTGLLAFGLNRLRRLRGAASLRRETR